MPHPTGTMMSTGLCPLSGRGAPYLRPGWATGCGLPRSTLPDGFMSIAIRCASGQSRPRCSLDEAFLRLPWRPLRNVDQGRPAVWAFAKQAAAAGLIGLTVPPTQTPGRNMVLWRRNEAGAPEIRLLNPLADLPTDQRSWQP